MMEETSMSFFDLTGTTALVTGATKGIGRGIAQQLAAHGARVVVSSRDQALCDQVAAELDAEFGQGQQVAKGIACDIDVLDDIERLAERATAEWGGIDTLVCNAAKLPYVGPSVDTPPALFDALLSTNVHHNFRLCHALRPQMAARGGGAMILIGSAGAHYPTPAHLAYSVAKAGLQHVATCLADEFCADRIRVNFVSPGLTRSHSSAPLFEKKEAEAAMARSIPLGRVGEPEDIAGAVVYLASRAGAFCTGNTLVIDGGAALLGKRPGGEDAFKHIPAGKVYG
jgi:NAD(P)-dependent dehydrogenase (short-subunit alcohol dehydrogenase family)